MFENISTQALLAGLSYGIIFILYLINVISKIKIGKFIFMATGLLIGLGLSALITYDINCLTVGKCTTWSWIRTISIIIILPLSFMSNTITRI